jgi:hypothetical protein
LISKKGSRLRTIGEVIDQIKPLHAKEENISTRVSGKTIWKKKQGKGDKG